MILPDTICLTGNSTFLRLTVVYHKSEQQVHRKNKSITDRYVGSFEDILRHMSGAEPVSNRHLDIIRELSGEFLAGLNHQEEHYAFVVVLWPPLPNADRICNVFGELCFEDAVDFS